MCAVSNQAQLLRGMPGERLVGNSAQAGSRVCRPQLCADSHLVERIRGDRERSRADAAVAFEGTQPAAGTAQIPCIAHRLFNRLFQGSTGTSTA
jgi:hypothetical protein